MLKKVIESMQQQEVHAHQTRLRSLAAEFGGVATKHGFADGEGCQPVCQDTIVIGPDGQPHHEVVCTMMCP
jgi:hypothetical protein